MRIIEDQSLDSTEPLWRYFKTDRFLDVLNSGHLYFAAARQFEDPFEGAVAVLAPGFPVDPKYAKPASSEQAFEQLRRLTKVANLAHVLEQPLTPNGIAMTIPDARNRSAHPREDEAIEWGVFIHSLKEMLGRPPAELLKLVVTLSVAGNAAQQGAAQDGDSAALRTRQ